MVLVDSRIMAAGSSWVRTVASSGSGHWSHKSTVPNGPEPQPGTSLVVDDSHGGSLHQRHGSVRPGQEPQQHKEVKTPNVGRTVRDAPARLGSLVPVVPVPVLVLVLVLKEMLVWKCLNSAFSPLFHLSFVCFRGSPRSVPRFGPISDRRRAPPPSVSRSYDVTLHM